MKASEAARTPAVFGCAGLSLNDDERRFFSKAAPAGFILFARNCETPDQVRGLVRALRDAAGYDAPVMIDQEGGRVARLGAPHWRHPPAAAVLGALPDPEAAEAVRLNTALIAHDLAALGIDMDCAPLIDVPAPDGHDIIGDRAFCDDPARIAALGRVMAETFLDHNVLPIIKHIPGHGRARADSHLELPHVNAARALLEAVDFIPFAALSDMPWAMTAHIVYEAIDAALPATLSPTIISGVIRGAIGFDGVLITDDLSMKALSGSFAEKASAALAAGCDLVLHCNGDMIEMEGVLAGASVFPEPARERLARGEAMIADRGRMAFDPAAAVRRLGDLLDRDGA